MLRAIADKEKVARCYELFKSRINGLGGKKLTVRVGFRMSNELESIVWVEDYDFWHELSADWWNAFGAGRPSLTGTNSIVCEINFPDKGIDRRVGGVFAESGDGTLYVLHRGRIGGGRKNIGKRGFVNSFTGKLIEFVDGDAVSRGVPVACFESRNFASQLSFFVHEVERFKENVAVNKKYADVVVPKGFYVPPYLGRWKRESTDPVDESFEHGLVVNTIANVLVTRGVRVETDWKNDLTTFSRLGTVRTVYEVETSRCDNSVYVAIGRLAGTSKRLGGKIRKVLALPGGYTGSSLHGKSVESDIRALGIRILPYRIVRGVVEFEEEKNILS